MKYTEKVYKEARMVAVNALSNLQPLWGNENRSKYNKY